jgi:uroporphyrinogen III methyltransferase / synthase
MSLLPNCLTGKKALIACSEMKSEALASGLRELGAEVTIFPVISMREIENKTALDAALSRLPEYAWIIFTSAYGVRFFLQRLAVLNLRISRGHGPEICAVGPATASLLEASGIDVALIPREFLAEGILDALAERHGGLHNLAGMRIMLPRARESRELLARVLEAAGAHVDAIPCYETILSEIEPSLIQAVIRNPPDLVVFTSSSTVQNFLALLGENEGTKILAAAHVAAIGPITTRKLDQCGKRAEIVPGENTIPSLLAAIRNFYHD